MLMEQILFCFVLIEKLFIELCYYQNYVIIKLEDGKGYVEVY